MLRSLGQKLGRRYAPKVGSIAPGPVARVLHEALARAIAGVGPLDSAHERAQSALKEADGDRDRAVDALVSSSVRLAGAQGFLTNIGGLVTLAATIPANISGLALLQCRMVASIASLHGHDLDDDGVRNAVLACILGEDAVQDLVRRKQLPGTPRQLAAGTAASASAVSDPGTPPPSIGGTELDRVVAGQVAGSLITSVLGKRMAVTVGKRIPLVGGVIGAGTDAWATRKVAAYARTQFATTPDAR